MFLEVFLRIFSPIHFCQSIETVQYDDELGYRARPAQHFFKLTDYQQEMRTNKIGTVNFQEDFNDYHHVIFALGDSHTQGTGSYSDASYTFQLDLFINVDERGRYKKEFAVVNLGLAAYGAEQNFLTYKRYADLIKKPAIILYLGSDNDYQDDILFKTGVRHKNIVEGSPFWGSSYYLLKWIFMDTEIGKRVKYVTQEKIFKAKAARQQAEISQGRSVAELEINAIERIINRAKEDNTVVILSWAVVQSPSYEWLKSWARKNDIAFADWWPSVQSVISNIPSLPLENNHSCRHHRTWVNNLIAREYARAVKETF